MAENPLVVSCPPVPGKAGLLRSGSYVRLGHYAFIRRRMNIEAPCTDRGDAVLAPASAILIGQLLDDNFCVQSCLKQGNVMCIGLCIEIGLNRPFGIIERFKFVGNQLGQIGEQFKPFVILMHGFSAREQGRVIFQFIFALLWRACFQALCASGGIFGTASFLLISGLLPASRSNRALAEGCGVIRISHLSMAAILEIVARSGTAYSGMVAETIFVSGNSAHAIGKDDIEAFSVFRNLSSAS